MHNQHLTAILDINDEPSTVLIEDIPATHINDPDDSMNRIAKVAHNGARTEYTVRSRTNRRATHTVTATRGAYDIRLRCTCTAASYGRPCNHTEHVAEIMAEDTALPILREHTRPTPPRTRSIDERRGGQHSNTHTAGSGRYKNHAALAL